MAMIYGLKVEESRGWLSRAFVLTGDDDALAAAFKFFEDFEASRKVVHPD